jgi:hypothetical protein
MQEIEKPTISEGSKWDLYETNATGFREGNQVGNEDGSHVLYERGLRNEVLHDLAAGGRRDRERNRRSRSNEVPTNEAERSADQLGQTKCRSTRLTKRVDLVLKNENMKNEK